MTSIIRSNFQAHPFHLVSPWPTHLVSLFYFIIFLSPPVLLIIMPILEYMGYYILPVKLAFTILFDIAGGSFLLAYFWSSIKEFFYLVWCLICVMDNKVLFFLVYVIILLFLYLFQHLSSSPDIMFASPTPPNLDINNAATEIQGGNGGPGGLGGPGGPGGPGGNNDLPFHVEFATTQQLRNRQEGSEGLFRALEIQIRENHERGTRLNIYSWRTNWNADEAYLTPTLRMKMHTLLTTAPNRPADYAFREGYVIDVHSGELAKATPQLLQLLKDTNTYYLRRYGLE